MFGIANEKQHPNKQNKNVKARGIGDGEGASCREQSVREGYVPWFIVIPL